MSLRGTTTSRIDLATTRLKVPVMYIKKRKLAFAGLVILALILMYRNSNLFTLTDGLVRSVREQQNEAIQILSIAAESSLAKHSKRLSRYHNGCDWTDGDWAKDVSIKYGEGILTNYTSCQVDYRQNCHKNAEGAPYLAYRWVLRNESCEAKRVRFTRETFLEVIRSKNVAFIGDSLTRNMFQSLACLLYSSDNGTSMVEINMYKYRYPAYNASIEFIVSNYLVNKTREDCDSDQTLKIANNPCIDLKTVDPAWADRVHEFDILLFATGGWWEHDLKMRQVSAKADKSYHKSKEILNDALRTVMDHLSKPEFKSKELFWRCSEVSHFFGGEWNSGGTCRRDKPSLVSKYNAVSLFMQEAVLHALYTTTANINLLDITRMSSYRQDAHPSSQTDIGGRTDCKHWCLPGVPDHWNEMWLNMLYKPV